MREKNNVLICELDFNDINSRNELIDKLNQFFGAEFKDLTPQELVDDGCCLMLNGYDQESKKMIRVDIENNVDKI